MRSYGRSIVLGCLLGLAFLHPLLWWLGLLAVAYWVSLLRDDKETYLTTFLLWFSVALMVLAWFWSVYPLSWVPAAITGPVALGAIGLNWVTAAISLGLGGVVVFGLYSLLKIVTDRALWGLPVYWVVGELVGAAAFSIVTYGAGTAGINSSFSFGFVGYLLAEHATLLQFARIGGVYGLSALLIGIAVGLYTLYQFQRLLSVLAFVALVLSAYAPITSYLAMSKETADVVIVDTYLARGNQQSVQMNNARQRQTALDRVLALDEAPDYILFPEDSRLFPVHYTGAQLSDVLQFSTDFDGVLIDSGRTDTAAGAILRARIYDGADTIVYETDKHYLVPQGEYITYKFSFVLQALGLGAVGRSLREQMSYVPGRQIISNTPTHIPAILFCFESVNPQGARTLLKAQPDTPFLAHVVSHSWFHEPVTLRHQLRSMLRVQAVHNQVSIISAGNHAPGELILPTGAVERPALLQAAEQFEIRRASVPIR